MSEETQQQAPAATPTAGRTLWNLLPLIILGLYLCHYSPSKRPDFQLEQCGKHLHQIGVTIEKDRLLSEDKLYNKEFKLIFGKHPIPACPAGGKDAYIEGYQVSADRKSYLLVCKGDHHKDAGVPSDYPRIAFSVTEADSSEKNRSTPGTVNGTPSVTDGASVDAVPTPSGAITATATPTVVPSAGAPSSAGTPVVVPSAAPHAQGQDQEHKRQETSSKERQENNKGVKQSQASPAPSATPKSK